jgi:hypothetical protein
MYAMYALLLQFRDFSKSITWLNFDIAAAPGRTLYDSDELVKADGGKPTMSIS